MDDSGAYYIEWSKSERERQILHINAYIWNLERWYRLSYLQGIKGDTDVKIRLLDSVGEGEGMLWENSIGTCTLPYIKQMTSASLMHEAGHPGGMGWGGRWEGNSGLWGTHVYLWPIYADSRQKPSQYCNYPPIKAEAFAWSFPSGSDGKSVCLQLRDPGSIPGSGRSPGEGNGNQRQYSCLENPMDGGAW